MHYQFSAIEPRLIPGPRFGPPMERRSPAPWPVAALLKAPGDHSRPSTAAR